MIAVVDYCKGNLQSVQRGLAFVGGDAEIVDDAAGIAAASAVVLPGVGAFADAAGALQASGQMDALRAAIQAQVPFLGICLGMHLLFAAGTETTPGHDQGTTVEGLGVLEGTVERMSETGQDARRYKVPHVGWNQVDYVEGRSCALFEGIPAGEHFYFTHSFVAPASPATCATVQHARRFPSAVSVGPACFGVQFHPEKSSDAGMQVLKNFVDLARG